MKFTILSERKSVEITGKRRMQIVKLVRYWMEHLRIGYRMVDTYGGYVGSNKTYVHERSFEVTVNAPLSALPKMKELARAIAQFANQEEVWIEYGRKTLRIIPTSELRRRKRLTSKDNRRLRICFLTDDGHFKTATAHQQWKDDKGRASYASSDCCCKQGRFPTDREQTVLGTCPSLCLSFAVRIDDRFSSARHQPPCDSIECGVGGHEGNLPVAPTRH